MTKKYKVKVSYGILIIIFLLFFIPVIFGIINNGLSQEIYVLIGILVLTYVFILHLTFTTNYTIDENLLKIKCGFLINKKIDIAEIKSVIKTSSLLSSPAPSFDRIEIKFGKFDGIIISPKDKITFVKDLTEINSKIINNIYES